MSRKHDMSHNACSVYDYSRCRWNLQPADIVKFYDKDSDFFCLGEVISVSLELLHVRRLNDNRIFVISTYDMKDWCLSRSDRVRRLQHGIFSIGERIDLNSAFNFSLEEFTIEKFVLPRVLLRYSTKGRTVGSFWVFQGEILKFKE